MQLSLPYHGKLYPDFSPRDRLVLFVAACVIAFLSLGAHDLAIAHLGIAYPDETEVPEWAKFLGQFIRLGAMVYFCRLASWFLDHLSAAASAALVGLLVVMLHETLRIMIVDVVMVDGWIAHRWVYMILQRLPFACMVFFWGASAALIARRLSGKGLPVISVAVLAATALAYFLLKPVLTNAASFIVRALQLTEPPELYEMPYGFYIYKFIYGAFIEPTIAMFIMAWLAWPGLRGSVTRRIAMLTAMTLLLRGRIIGTFLFSHWVHQAPAMAVAAEAQFFAETLVLALLTGLVWAWRIRVSAAAAR